ncbi:MAG: PEP-CTERM sorting domain-containing protein [Bythopirellula sp.]|nr:PEP-CTERM sorting domain-containing protein [Bythopirellula sp.]
MKNFNLGSLALAVVVALSTFAQAGSFSIVGGGLLPAGTTSGVLDIVYNPIPGGVTFGNGGVALSVLSSTPGVIKFTGASVLNPAGRWTAVIATPPTDDAASALDGFSVGTQGLSSTLTSIYAQLNYEVLGSGTTILSLATHGEDALFDGAQGDVSSTTQLVGTPVTVASEIPEPASLAMAGMGLIGLAFRRRNG